MCSRVMRLVASVYIYTDATNIYVCVCVCHKKITRLVSSRSKNFRKSAYKTFFSYLDIVNVTLNCWFTQDQVLLLLRLCAPLGVAGPRVHTHTHVQWLVCVFLRLPQKLTWRASDDYSVLLGAAGVCSAASFSLTVLSVNRVYDSSCYMYCY